MKFGEAGHSVGVRHANAAARAWPGAGVRRLSARDSLNARKDNSVDLSFVIPVFNGSHGIRTVVQDIFSSSGDVRLEIVLVNDGSSDQSEQVCAALAQEYPGEIVFVQLARNFGEHNAVMAGLRRTRGRFAAVMDDDGQHAAADAFRMFDHARNGNFDVVYGRFRSRHHSMYRVAGSRLTNHLARHLLNKPRGLYLSSFKVMNRFVIDEICQYLGPSAYIDGLILRLTDNLSQIDVGHHPRGSGRSGYTPGKLVRLWLDIFTNYSVVPLRLLLAAALLFTMVGVAALAALFVLSAFIAVAEVAWIAALIVAAAGLQMLALGIVGEYVGKILMHQNGQPQTVTRYVRRDEPLESAVSNPRQQKTRDFPLRLI